MSYHSGPSIFKILERSSRGNHTRGTHKLDRLVNSEKIIIDCFNNVLKLHNRSLDKLVDKIEESTSLKLNCKKV